MGLPAHRGAQAGAEPFARVEGMPSGDTKANGIFIRIGVLAPFLPLAGKINRGSWAYLIGHEPE